MSSWLKRYIVTPLRKIVRAVQKFWNRNWLTKIVLVILTLMIAFVVAMFAIAQWYIASTKSQPFKLGVTFIPDYSRSLGLDPQANMDALIRDVGVNHFRLVSYWSDIEKQQGTYDFSDLDWQFQKAEAAHANISLSIGIRQPRWPECHVPDWTHKTTVPLLQTEIDAYMQAVINRYKNSPSLESYQLENEYFNNFGGCTDYNRSRLVHEYDLAKRTDSRHPIIISKSNNFPGGSFGKPQPDIVGVSVYRRVWDAQITKRYFNYPLPSWYYAANAGIQKIVTGKQSVIHELQMEPWPPRGEFIGNVSLPEQDKSMNAQMFAGRIRFAKGTGMRQVDLWGSEWWYWRLQHGDPGVWNEAKKAFQNN